MADLPGLIEGAHQGKGLGHDFLRHIQRTRTILMLLDSASEDPAGDREKLNRELREYSEDLTRKPTVVAMSRSDLRGDEAHGGPPFSLDGAHWGGWISGVTGVGLENLLTMIWDVLIGAGAEKPAERRVGGDRGVAGTEEQGPW